MNDQINKFVAAYAKSQDISESAAKEKIMLAGCGRINALRKYANRLKKGEVHPPSLEKRKAAPKKAKAAKPKASKPKAKKASGGSAPKSVTQRAMERVAKKTAEAVAPVEEKLTGMSAI